MSIADEFVRTSVVVRVAERDRTVEWFRRTLGLEPMMISADGADYQIATYRLANTNIVILQLSAGMTRDRADSDRNTFLALMHPEPRAIHAVLLAADADVGPLSGSEQHVFFFLHDPDGNRYEISSLPTTS